MQGTPHNLKKRTRRPEREPRCATAELLVIEEAEVFHLKECAARVSPDGAFVITDTKLPEGAPVRLLFTLGGHTSPRARVCVPGSVLHAGPHGVEIRFRLFGARPERGLPPAV